MRLFQVSRCCSDTVHMVVIWMTLPHSGVLILVETLNTVREGWGVCDQLPCQLFPLGLVFSLAYQTHFPCQNPFKLITELQLALYGNNDGRQLGVAFLKVNFSDK